MPELVKLKKNFLHLKINRYLIKSVYQFQQINQN